MDSERLDNKLLQQTSVSDLPGPERDIFIIVIVDLILRSALVRCSLLRVEYYYNLTEQVCYVYSVYNLWSYIELSINVYFMLLQYKPDEVNFLILYFDLQ